MRSVVRPALVALAVLFLIRAAAADDAAFRTEHELATRMILCDCGCSPQSVHDCACGRAAEMRDAMAAEIRSGKTGQQVIDGYVARYGEKIRISPSASGFNLVAWLGPGLALLGGILAMVLVLKRWRLRSAPAPVAVAGTVPPSDERYVAEIERRLREYE